MFVSNIIAVEDVLVRPEIAEKEFSCDLSKCKGACCTLESEYGAPLLEEEIEQIENVLPIVKDYIPEVHYKKIKKQGFYEERDGELLVKSVKNKACVFVYYDGEIARCGIEKAFFDGKIEFRKPISCHLFPIRVSKFGGDILRYEVFPECNPALEKGVKERIKIMDFCKDSLVRNYGQKWFSKLKEITGTKDVIT